ncbi:MAG: hypothetical protein QM651_19320, partial [Rhodoblastus sp.]
HTLDPAGLPPVLTALLAVAPVEDGRILETVSHRAARCPPFRAPPVAAAAGPLISRSGGGRLGASV